MLIFEKDAYLDKFTFASENSVPIISQVTPTSRHRDVCTNVGACFGQEPSRKCM